MGKLAEENRSLKDEMEVLKCQLEEVMKTGAPLRDRAPPSKTDKMKPGKVPKSAVARASPSQKMEVDD